MHPRSWDWARARARVLRRRARSVGGRAQASAGLTLAVAPPIEDRVDLVVDAVAGRSAVNS
jgi:hypothetical protein